VHAQFTDFTPQVDPEDVPKVQNWTSAQIYRTMRNEYAKYDMDWMRSDGLRLAQYYQLANFTCEERLLYLAEIASVCSENLDTWHLNFTGTAGLNWLTSDMPPDTDRAWAWLIHYFLEKVMINLNGYIHKAMIVSIDYPECLSPQLRETFTILITRYRKQMQTRSALLWNAFAFGLLGDVTNDDNADPETLDQLPEPGRPNHRQNFIFAHMLTGQLNAWMKEHVELLHGQIRIDIANKAYDHEVRNHHQDANGHFMYFEALRREVFQQWAMDKGLLRGFLKMIDLNAGITVADFGAGGGRYSRWLNETGLVTSFAFDGTPGIDRIAAGVQNLNLNEPNMTLWRTFDWVMCIEVAEHIPAQFTDTFLQNIHRHAKEGIIMSWSADLEGIGHVNVLPEKDFHARVEDLLPLRVDEKATAALRAACQVDYIGRSVTVFRRIISAHHKGDHTVVKGKGEETEKNSEGAAERRRTTENSTSTWTSMMPPWVTR